MRLIERIILHCSYTRPSQDIGAETIREWHVEGNGWRDIGYHYVIRRDGTVETGRPLDEPGAHAAGHNEDSVGVCLIGGRVEEKDEPESNFTAAQLAAAERLILQLRAAALPGESEPIEVIGHRDVDPSRRCPCLNAGALIQEVIE